MILVTCGTQKQSFQRLFSYIEQLKVDEDIIMQVGYNKINSQYPHYDFSSNFTNDLQQANLVITHGGVGSIMQALLLGKKVIVVPRLEKYHEHVSDHQLEISNKLAQEKYLYIAQDFTTLQNLVSQYHHLEFKPYPSNNQFFNQQFIALIRKIENDQIK